MNSGHCSIAARRRCLMRWLTRVSTIQAPAIALAMTAMIAAMGWMLCRVLSAMKMVPAAPAMTSEAMSLCCLCSATLMSRPAAVSMAAIFRSRIAMCGPAGYVLLRVALLYRAARAADDERYLSGLSTPQLHGRGVRAPNWAAILSLIGRVLPRNMKSMMNPMPARPVSVSRAQAMNRFKRSPAEVQGDAQSAS